MCYAVAQSKNISAMKHLLFQVLLITGLLFSQNVNGQSIDRNELEAEIDAMVPSHIDDSTPGLVVGVVQNGELVFSKGYGLANMAYEIPNDPEMVYNIGSVAKQFLGYAFAMLHVKGELDIDDPVSKYLEDWPEFDQPVTLRHLLSHTSGYREAYTISNLAGRPIGIDRLSKKESLDVVRNQPQLEFSPGSSYTYNSTAWVILAEVLENVTNQPADEWVESNILTPLGMGDTQIESHVGEVIKNAAESYSYRDGQGYTNEKSNRAIFGAADVFTSVHDLVKWLNNYRTAEIGGDEVNELFFDPFVLNDGINSGYALGIRNNSHRGLKRYSHTGGHEGFSTQLSYYPDHDLGIILISNFGGRGSISSARIAEFLLEEHMTSPKDYSDETVDIENDKLQEFTGLYLASTENQTMTVSMAEGSLSLGGQTKLLPTSPNTFRINGRDGHIKIDALPNGKPQLTMVNSNSKEVYNRVKSWSPGIDELSVFEGKYWSDELETVYHLIIKDEQLTIEHRWLGELVLEPVMKNLFKTSRGFYVNFTRNENEVSGLNINSGRTLNVFFQRQQ